MLGTVQMAMIAGLQFTVLRDAVLSHPTMVEGFNNLFANFPQSERLNQPNY